MSSQLKIGDKIRFLNAEGGGRVLRIEGKIAYVEDQDGFEIPTPVSECVVVGEKAGFIPAYTPPVISSRNSKAADNTQNEKSVVVESAGTEIAETPDDLIMPTYRSTVPMLRNDQLNVYLAFLPVDETKLGQEPYESYLINDSNYMLSFSYMSKDGDGWRLRAAGVLEANSKIFMDEFSSSELNDLEDVALSLLTFKQNERFELKPALTVEIRLDITRFFKLHAFQENDFFDEGAIVYPVVEKDKAFKSVIVTSDDLQEAMNAKFHLDSKRSKKPQAARRKKIDAPIEIDLHAHELLETTAGMEPKDILDYQINYFHKVLEEHKKDKGCKIVFIHGKGEGVLRKAIEKELKHKYKNYSFQDASFREYGFGATMVTIR